jgi:hypothetical protein
MRWFYYGKEIYRLCAPELSDIRDISGIPRHTDDVFPVCFRKAVRRGAINLGAYHFDNCVKGHKQREDIFKEEIE